MTDRVRHLFSAIEAEHALGIKAATIRSWARRERIYSFGLDRRNHPMYDRDDLVKLRDKKVDREYTGDRQRKPRRVREHRRGRAD